MSEQDKHTVADRFEAYLLGQLDDAAMDQLEEALRGDPQLADECVAAMASMAMVREQFRDQHEQSGELTKDPTLHSFHSLLGELSAMEDAAEAQTVEWVGQIKTAKPIWQQWQVVVPSGIAALLAIAVILIVALPNGNTTTSNPPIANDLNQPGIEPALNDVVATLTAERDAVWAEGALATGSPLRKGQRFTLTQGFAEITTNDGAIAILQAPATVELLDNDNALELHSGKLVGICETASSKGFLVRTPHMDVTDLGTRFGVDATDPNATQTHVLEGVVRVARPGVGDASQTVRAGSAVVARADLNQIMPLPAEPVRFAALMPQRIDLPGTGRGLEAGAIDPNWQVIAVDGQRLNRAAHFKVGQPSTGGTATAKNDPSTSQWLDGSHTQRPRALTDTVFTCRSFFELPDGVDEQAVALVLKFAADNHVEAIRINGRSFSVPANDWGDSQGGFTTLRIAEGLAPGINTIELDILDKVKGGSTKWSFNLRWHLEAGLGTPP